METLLKMKDLIERISVDTRKVFEKGNKSASIRARKNAQEIKNIISTYRKEILQEIKRHD
jgi:predicted transcriptional regulator